ncbi:MAG: tetratricopeptide repeat protein [Microcoleaceae cyanobacterium]
MKLNSTKSLNLPHSPSQHPQIQHLHIQQAIETYQQAVEILESLGDRFSIGIMLYHIGFLNSQLGKSQAALQAYQQALVIFQDLGDRSREAITYYGLALIYSQLGQTQRELDLYTQAQLLGIDQNRNSAVAKTA